MRSTVPLRLPPRLHLGGRAVQTWRLCAGAGVIGGTAWLLLLTAATGGALPIALGLVPLLLAGFVGFSLLRRRIVGRETTVLLEHLAVALAIAAAALFAAGQDVLRWLDRLVPALAVLFAFGRVGCAAAGCCHGVLLAYGAVRTRFPTQWTEAACWALLALAGGGVAVVGPEGSAAAGVLAAYAVVRSALEGVRGDRRPHWLGVSGARWMSLGLLAIALGLGPQPVGAGGWALAGAGGAAAAALFGTRRWWLAQEPGLPHAELVAWGAGLSSLAPGELRQTSAGAGLSVVASLDGADRVVSVAGGGEIEAEALLEAVGEGLGAAPRSIQQARPGLYLAIWPGLASLPERPELPRAAPPHGSPRPSSYFDGSH